jgi:hypothetical protein
MPWAVAGALLVLASVSALSYCRYKHDGWVAEALTRDVRRGYKEFWHDSAYYAFLIFFVLFMTGEAIAICSQADSQSSSVVLAAFATACTSIAATQLPRIFARRSPKEER